MVDAEVEGMSVLPTGIQKATHWNLCALIADLEGKAVHYDYSSGLVEGYVKKDGNVHTNHVHEHACGHEYAVVDYKSSIVVQTFAGWWAKERLQWAM